MKALLQPRFRYTLAFTLIELLVVIAVIGILAALILPLTGALKIRAARSKAAAELAQIALAIDDYKERYGHYPPDRSRWRAGWPVNQLYFELIGTRYANNEFVTLDDSVRIADTDQAFGDAFGLFNGKPVVRGFINCTRTANADDAPAAKNFLPGLKPTQYADTRPDELRLLVCSVQWPLTDAYPPIAGFPGLNPWRYDSSSTNRHNLGSYDLWVDILVGGKTNRISNWSKQAQIVDTP